MTGFYMITASDMKKLIHGKKGVSFVRYFFFLYISIHSINFEYCDVMMNRIENVFLIANLLVIKLDQLIDDSHQQGFYELFDI